ncbi:hypothetical protein BHE74_00043460 [Ensete ventricosum]|nr:hypothetical protein BHE74_00043460 [Ensete ventricosum]RZR93900.1 hypothetical protein BHM03_00022488 [Ensete ventricosum]
MFTVHTIYMLRSCITFGGAFKQGSPFWGEEEWTVRNRLRKRREEGRGNKRWRRKKEVAVEEKEEEEEKR